MGTDGAAARLAAALERVLGRPFPLAIRAWDGSRAGPCAGPTLVVKTRRALRRILWKPDEVGLARAWVTGDLDVDGDLETALGQLESSVADLSGRPALTRFERLKLARTALRLGAVGLPPAVPPEEADLSGDRHSKDRDRAAIGHHYDVGNDFYEIVLGPSMAYSCAYWARDPSAHPGYTLEDAQRDKIELICRKLALKPGARVLDIGCGWGSLVLHAARAHGARAVGVTLSAAQAEYAQRRIDQAGLSGLAQIRQQDWRDVTDGPYDAIASVGMAEHLGAQGWVEYAERLHGLLRPGGRLLNHQIVRRHRSVRHPSRRSFIDAYVFPDGELIGLGEVIDRLEAPGLEVRDVESLREHYAHTLRQWVANLDRGWDAAVAAAGSGRARVWKLYMTGSALSFDAGRISVAQVLAVRPDSDGRSDMPLTRPVGWSL